ncbi:MAG: sensor histidine kinase [Candidatus Kapaibacterium sp.]|nr:MAG: sensor histidine kinase [Candidatus Kapabacteria bacterium]
MYHSVLNAWRNLEFCVVYVRIVSFYSLPRLGYVMACPFSFALWLRRICVWWGVCVAAFLVEGSIYAFAQEQQFKFQYSQFAPLPPTSRPDARLYETAETLLNNGLLDSTIAFSKRYIQEYQAHSDIASCMYAEWTIGRAYGRKGESSVMYKHFFQALRMAEEQKNVFWQAFMALSIGSMSTQNALLDRADAFLHTALELGTSLNDSLMVANAMSGFSEIANKKNNPRLSLELAQKAITAMPKSALPLSYEYFILGHLKLRLAYAFSYLGQQDSALVVLRDASVYLKNSSNQRFVPEMYLAFARIHLLKKKYTEASLALDSAEVFIEKMRLQITRFALYRMRAELADSLGNYQSAYRYYQLFHNIRDSIFSTQSAATSESLKNDFAKRLVEQEKKYQAWVATAVIAALCGIIIVLFILFQLKRRTELTLLDNKAHLEHLTEELQQTNQQLQERNHDLAEAHKLKNTFLGIVSHDLRNPLTQIMMSTEMIDHQVQKYIGDGFQATIIPTITQRILQSAEFMNQLIQDLLDVNKLESGGVSLYIKPISLKQIIEIFTRFETLAAKKQITLLLEPASDTIAHWKLLADERALRQVMDNLLSNAIKFSPLGAKIAVKISASTSLQTESNIRIEICDEGPGLSEEDKAKAFEKFTRLSAKPTAGESSTGLGLAICKELIRQMNGEIGVNSTLGNGATFYIVLPKAA